MLLSEYQSLVQDLLHDPENQIWSQQQIINYINEGRDRIATDTWCLRQITGTDDASLQFTAGTEFFNPQTFLGSSIGSVLVGTLGITVVINNRRVALKYAPYTWLSANLRVYSNTQMIPRYWSIVSPAQYVIEPVPNQTYPCEFDIAITPNDLTGQSGEVDQIPVPFQNPVQYFAAYKAKLYQQQLQEAQLFLSIYISEAKRIRSAFGPRFTPSPRGR